MLTPEEHAKTAVADVLKDQDTVRDVLWAISKVERSIGRPMTTHDVTALFSELKAPTTHAIRLVVDGAETGSGTGI